MRTIIFDLGNVVCFFDHAPAFAKLARFTNLLPEQMFDAVYGGPLYAELERGHLTGPTFLRRTQQHCQMRCDVDFLAHALSDIFAPNPEVCGLIPLLKGRYRLVLGSNTNAIHARRYFKQFAAVLGQFDALGLSHEMGARKPDADFYHACLHMAKARPADCVFVDDLPENIEGARAVGMHGIVYRPNDGLAEKLCALGVAV